MIFDLLAIMTKLIARLIALWLVPVLIANMSLAVASTLISGQVTDTDGQPIIGASLTIGVAGQTVAATATDEDGNYSITSPESYLQEVTMKISSIGFERTTRSIQSGDSAYVFDVTLVQRAIPISDVIVVVNTNESGQSRAVSKRQLDRRASRSIVPTNPVSALVEPQVVRQGSQHSSKIRVHGTSPDYFINGSRIGSDPNHYGTFSIIPGSVVERLRFHPQGTSAQFVLPSVIEMETPVRFERHFNGEISLSLVEATGSLAFGNEKMFAIGTLRKSVLDKLVRSSEMDGDHRTIPPTNFQDVFVSTGARLSARHLLIVDQYHVQDFLSYTIATSGSNGVAMFQHTKESYVGVRYHGQLGRSSIRAQLSGRISKELYRVTPHVVLNQSVADNLYLDLSEHYRSFVASLQVEMPLSNRGGPLLVVGADLDYVASRELKLSHQHWNFLPPDATSDNPFIYQPELDELYQDYQDRGAETNSSTFATVEYQLGSLRSESGIRLDYFGNLKRTATVNIRQQVDIPIGDYSEFGFFAGTFSENPRKKLLGAYQVAVRRDISDLDPIRTALISTSYQYGPLRLGLFAKRLTNLPVLTPDFSAVNTTGTVDEGFLSMRSSGSINFYGGDITLDLPGLISNKVDVYAFYAYSQARTKTDGVATDYELSSPHTLAVQLSYRPGRKLTLGADLGLRSGHPYTPHQVPDNLDDRYSSDFYHQELGRVSTARFPMHASIDLHAELTTGGSSWYLNVANVTNRGNPIINSSDGYIYDAGILPTIGFKHRF